jgi:ribosome maturation factor RimP
MNNTQRIRSLLEDLFTEGPLSDCFVIDVTQKGTKSVTVFIDSDSGVTFDKCTQVSRYLEKRMDEENLFGGDYVLDVSSPGAERPLMLWRQYPRHRGRTLLVTLKDGSELEGVLAEVGLETVTLQMEKGESMVIPFSDIEKSLVQIRF